MPGTGSTSPSCGLTSWIWEVKIVNTLHDQMNEDDQSTLNPIRTVFFFCICNMGWYCFHELLEISLASLFLLPVLSPFLYLSKWYIKKLHGAFLVILNLNIPFILFVTVIILFVIISGLIEGNLRSLHLNILK